MKKIKGIELLVEPSNLKMVHNAQTTYLEDEPMIFEILSR